jgi:lysophospholipase L1-like esterase
MARLLLLVVSTALALLMAEAAARLLIPSWQPRVSDRAIFWHHHPVLGWAHRPGALGRFVGPSWDVGVAINSKGLRDAEHAYEKASPDTRRLLLLGDSQGWGFGVERDQGLASLLGELCAGWEVINGSVSGYSTDQEYLYFRDEGWRYAPDVVLLLIHDNDLAGNVRSRNYGYEKPLYVFGAKGLELQNVPVRERRAWERLYTGLVSHSYLANGGLRLSGVAAMLESGEPIGVDRVLVKPEATRRILSLFAKEVRARGAELRAALVPMSQENAEALVPVVRRAGLPTLYLGPTFEAARATGTQLLLEFDRHWNAEGHRIAARAIADDLGCAR